MSETSKPHSELEVAMTTLPLDCTGDCDYGPCNCSGEHRPIAYTKASVDRLVEQLEALSGVALFQTDDGGWQLELHDKGWNVEVTLHPDRSTEFYASPFAEQVPNPASEPKP